MLRVLHCNILWKHRRPLLQSAVESSLWRAQHACEKIRRIPTRFLPPRCRQSCQGHEAAYGWHTRDEKMCASVRPMRLILPTLLAVFAYLGIAASSGPYGLTRQQPRQVLHLACIPSRPFVLACPGWDAFWPRAREMTEAMRGVLVTVSPESGKVFDPCCMRHTRIRPCSGQGAQQLLDLLMLIRATMVFGCARQQCSWMFP